jgi:dihydrofolate reductase
MRKVVVTMFLSLDGVMEDPQNWSFPYWTDEIGKFKSDELFASDAQLLGRVTYQGFAAAWPSRSDDYADRLNSLPKYVVSTTLERAEWYNSHLIRANVAEEVSRLRQQPGQDILVHGSPTLVQTLMQDDLVDEYRLLVFPVVLGSGKQLFKDGSKTSLNLIESRAFSSGVVLLRYQPERKE